MGLRTFSDTLQALTTWSQQHNSFATGIPGLQETIAFAHNTDSGTNRFLRTLADPVFANTTSSTMRVGPVLAALPQFLNLQNTFCSPLKTIAELDAYLSIATLYTEFKNLPRSYCFAEFEEKSTTPLLTYTDFWHPSLPVTRAVPNSIALGCDNHARNVILTGPNAAGKSTVSKALILNALLAQSFTIAPAATTRLTPFTHINTYLNVVQDVGERSAHRAEVQRSKELIDEIMCAAKKEFSLTMIDEMYRHTDPTIGAASSFGVAKGLGEEEDSLLILATHYSRLTGLPAHAGTYENYKVEANRNADGTYHYPYQMVPGANETVIVFDMMVNEGFNEEILSFAYEHFAAVPRSGKGQPERSMRDVSDIIDQYVHDLYEKAAESA